VRHPIRSTSGLAALRPLEPMQDVPFVLDTVRLLKDELGPGRAVIGFAGGPFTLAAYLIEGRPSRDFGLTKAMMYREPGLWHALMDRLTDIMITYLQAKAAAGVDALQLFDSWAGCLALRDYVAFVKPYSRRIFSALAPTGLPLIHFGTNTAGLLGEMADAGGTVIGVDWRLPLDVAWERIGADRGIQGNLDPSVLLGPVEVIDAEADQGQHDVGEHHRGVQVHAPHRLQRHVRAERRIAADVHERVALPECTVFRQHAPRLPHEPDGGALGGLEARGANEEAG
jgi:uroporphyrinogen decarboxylase